MHMFLEGPLALEGVECWLLLSQPGVRARLSPVITLASVFASSAVWLGPWPRQLLGSPSPDGSSA